MHIIDRRGRRGFTLIELVVVLAVLVILSAGIIAKLDVLQLRANKGVAASDMGGISRLIQTYVIANNRYPDQFDSLVSGAGLLYTNLDPQLCRGPGSTRQKLVAGAPLTSGEVDSLGRMGLTTVCDITSATDTGFPSDRFQTFRALAPGGAVAILNATLDGSPTNDARAQGIMEAFYPATPSTTAGTRPAGTRVVVFGLGPRCTLVGRSGLMQSAPLYANCPDRNRFYARDLVCFEVSDGGKRARFLGALGGDGDLMTEEITGYYDDQ